MSEEFQTSSAMRLVAHRLGQVETTMKTLASHVEKLVLIEERQAQTTGALERAFKLLAEMDRSFKSAHNELERRVQALEMSQTINSRTNVWVERAVLFVVGGVGAVAFKQFFLVG